MDVVPSPKFQLQAEIVPSESDELSVNCTISAVDGDDGEKVKLAIGFEFAGGGDDGDEVVNVASEDVVMLPALSVDLTL